jgi:hypothetical protein
VRPIVKSLLKGFLLVLSGALTSSLVKMREKRQEELDRSLNADLAGKPGSEGKISSNSKKGAKNKPNS